MPPLNVPPSPLTGPAYVAQTIIMESVISVLTFVDNTRKTARKIRRQPRTTTVNAAAWAIQNRSTVRSVVANYAIPVAGATLAGNIVGVLPPGSMRTIVTTLTKMMATFRLRQVTVGTFYAMLHAAGLSSVWGQIFSLLGFMSLGATLGPLGATLQSQLTSLLLSGGPMTPFLGLTLSIFMRALGFLGTVPDVLLYKSFSALYKEMSSFVIFRGLGLSIDIAENLWRQNARVIYSFLEYGRVFIQSRGKDGAKEKRAGRRNVIMPRWKAGTIDKEAKGQGKDKRWKAVGKVVVINGVTGMAKKGVEGLGKMVGWNKKADEKYPYQQTGGRVVESLDEWQIIHGERSRNSSPGEGSATV